MKLLTIAAFLSCLATACVEPSDDAPPPPTTPAFKGDCVVNGCPTGWTCNPTTGGCVDPTAPCSSCSCFTCAPGQHCELVNAPPGSYPLNYPACFAGCTSNASCAPPDYCVQLDPPQPGTCMPLTMID